MVRGVTIAVGFWAVLAMPALCLGGIFVRACDCGGAVQCGHESTCWVDPCGQIAVRSRSQELDVDIAVSLPAADWCFPPLDADLSAGGAHESLSGFPSRRNLPYARSDIPLLI